MIEIINSMIMNFKIVIQNALYDISVAPPDTETLASQLKEWLSAQPPLSMTLLHWARYLVYLTEQLMVV